MLIDRSKSQSPVFINPKPLKEFGKEHRNTESQAVHTFRAWASAAQQRAVSIVSDHCSSDNLIDDEASHSLDTYPSVDCLQIFCKEVTNQLKRCAM